ncbi:hypothetical protein POTOM_046523 [Populus tomentosa]|uniref:DUF7642 domain-containing protein n=1 Tax=Populus tomentosa TaxID=118781 RepID=A0A8X7YEU6_POPTO|nr:hypothetical protein POTOM_046523 [Populus tomentosa]
MLHFRVLMGHADGLSEPGSSSNHPIAYPESVFDVEDEEEQILYAASFEELARNHVKYDTIIWVSISLLLVLAWGIGIILLLCLPIRRCLLQKDISSRKLYVTANEIVYKFSRPSILFWRVTTIEKRTPLSSVIDIITEQAYGLKRRNGYAVFFQPGYVIGCTAVQTATVVLVVVKLSCKNFWLATREPLRKSCLQSVYGLHTFRVESIAHGKAAPVDELRVQGVADPGVLRKVIITEASKNAQDFGEGCKPTLTGEEERLSRGGSLSEGPVIFKSPSKSWKITGSPRYTSLEHRGLIQGEVLLNKLEEVSKSLKKIESHIKKSQASPESR